MSADELESQDEHILHSVVLQHPLLQLMPYPQGAPRALHNLQKLTRNAADEDHPYSLRLEAALGIRAAVIRLGLGLQETSRVAVDLLQGLNELLESPAVTEQLAWASLECRGIQLEDREFCDPPLHPLPTLVRTANGGKRVPATSLIELGDAVGIWAKAVSDLGARPAPTFDNMSATDIRAALRMLILYCMHQDLDTSRINELGKINCFDRMGLSLWDTLLTALRDSSDYTPIDEQRYGVPAQRSLWHLLRSKAILPSVSGTAPSSTAQTKPSAAAGSLVVIRGVIPPGANDEDRNTLTRYEALRNPMPVAPLRDVASIDAFEETLAAEFPWATSAITAIAGDLRSRRLFGGVELGMEPTLFVGQPGCGKSRLARRVAEELRLPFWSISLAAMGDSRAILGTARGWSTGQASPLVNLLLEKSSASALVLLDELDKACTTLRSDVPPTSTLLNLLEPENAQRWYDTYLQTACDLSKVMYLATANALSPIPKPLMSRLRVILVPEPRRSDFPSIARGALLDIAREWGLPDMTFAELADSMPLASASNAREIRRFVREYLNGWARRSLGPGRTH